MILTLLAVLATGAPAVLLLSRIRADRRAWARLAEDPAALSALYRAAAKVEVER